MTEETELDRRRQHLLLARVLAGLTGDETFGQLLDAIDDYADAAINAAISESARRSSRRNAR